MVIALVLIESNAWKEKVHPTCKVLRLPQVLHICYLDLKETLEVVVIIFSGTAINVFYGNNIY